MALYDATAGDHWTSNQGWTRDNVDLDEWHGVTTDPSGRIVLELVLEENALFGTLPPELADLANLQKLDLSGNQLQGEIPSEFANLSSLQDLDLGQNQLRGEIPWELGDLTFLEALVLAANRLDGEVPPVLGDLTRLRTLDLGQNQLGGEIPPELGNLGALVMLHLQDNLLEGTIPQELGDLANLTGLDLSGNAALSGCMPEGSPVGFCTPPTNLEMRREEPTTIVLSWDPVEGASNYKVVWDSASFRYCNSTDSDPPFGCGLLDSEVLETTYIHETASRGFNAYGVQACTLSPNVCSSFAGTRGTP